MATTWIIFFCYNENMEEKKQKILVINNIQPKSLLLIISERGKKSIPYTRTEKIAVQLYMNY